jgi:hypothetical protein
LKNKSVKAVAPLYEVLSNIWGSIEKFIKSTDDLPFWGLKHPSISFNSEKSFDPRKPQKARKYSTRYQVVDRYLKDGGFAVQHADLSWTNRRF